MAESNASKFSSKITSDGTIGQGGLAAGVGGTDWQAVKTTSFTAVAGEGYFVNTTSGSITVTLPGTATVGDTIVLKDYNGTWATNNVTISSTLKISGADSDGTLSTNNTTVTIVYMDTTKGWTPIQNSTQSALAEDNLFVTATGGTVTESGDYKIHTFTGDGCFVVSCGGNPAGSTTVDYLVVAGAGGAGSDNAGGGGGGGYRESHSTPVSGCYTASPKATPTGIAVTATTYPITVGSGGAGGGLPSAPGANGSPSVFSTIISAGGGFGAGDANQLPLNPGPGGPGGSGGGGAFGSNAPVRVGGTGNQPPVSPPQGNPGGTGNPSSVAGGGGGAGGSGSAPGGGPGTCTAITGSTVPYSAGGNGGSSPGVGPSGGANTGNGGAGPGPGGASLGGSGGSGIVIIRYKFQ